ncbi:MAG: hypothetical protein ABSF81_17655 [Bacteroidales bacterium]
MSYYSYTILESTNPELLSSGSTFVKESNSELLKIKDGKAHFLTRKDTMDEEIMKLSLKYSGETFTAEFIWDSEYYNRIRYFLEYKNGECRQVGIEPDYLFMCPEQEMFNEEHYSALRKHVLEYLKRLDIVKAKNGKFDIDTLGESLDQYGYRSFITITYENDIYKWTAKRVSLSMIEVSCEKKEPKINPLKEYENNLLKNKEIAKENEDDNYLPF